MKKSRTKSPALEIDAKTISWLAELNDCTSGVALRWMIATLRGETITVSEERIQLGGRFDSIHAKLKPMLDVEKFNEGAIVVQFVNSKLEHQRRISKLRSQANASRKIHGVSPDRQPKSHAPFSKSATFPISEVPIPDQVDALVIDKAVGPNVSTSVTHVDGNVGTLQLERLPVERLPVERLPVERLPVERLQAMGVTDQQALSAIGRLTTEYGRDAVRQALDRMQERKLARPIAYLETSLENSRKKQVEAVPLYIKTESVASGATPRGIKRYQRVPVGSPYQLLGWTCRNHPRAADGIRRKIWRTDAGSLAYKRAEINEPIPDFNEDCGCYEEE